LDWRQRLLAEWPNNLQKHYLAQAAVRELDKALEVLATLGFLLHIEEGAAETVPQWPRMVFHIRAGSREVTCQADLDELGPDWYPSMEEARHAAGMTKQMQRGGVFDRALPSQIVLSDPGPGEPDQVALTRQVMDDWVRQVRAQNRVNGFGDQKMEIL